MRGFDSGFSGFAAFTGLTSALSLASDVPDGLLITPMDISRDVRHVRQRDHRLRQRALRGYGPLRGVRLRGAQRLE